jgi:uncharacterized protein YciU (UPF0263 family)
MVTAYDSVVELLVERLTPEEILAFKVSPEEQERVRFLRERNNDGTITPEEYSELEKAVSFERLFLVLKTRALDSLDEA